MSYSTDVADTDANRLETRSGLHAHGGGKHLKLESDLVLCTVQY